MKNEKTALARIAPNNMQPKNMRDLWDLAEHVSEIGFCGHRSTESAYICMMAGAEYGLSAIQSLRGIYVIEGKPSPSADMMVSFARRSKACEYMRVKVSNAKECVYEAKRVGEPEQLVSWTIEEAKQADLAKKTNWKRYPADMLRARAAARCARQCFPEAVAGFFIAEEIEAIHAGAAEIIDPEDSIQEHRAEAVEAEIVDTVTEQFDALLIEAVMGSSRFTGASSPEDVVESFKAAMATLGGVDGWHAIPPGRRSQMFEKFKAIAAADRANRISTTIEKAEAKSEPEGDDRAKANRTFYAKLGEALEGDADAVVEYKTHRKGELGIESIAELDAAQLWAEVDLIGSGEAWDEWYASFYGGE